MHDQFDFDLCDQEYHGYAAEGVTHISLSVDDDKSGEMRADYEGSEAGGGKIMITEAGSARPDCPKIELQMRRIYTG